MKSKGAELVPTTKTSTLNQLVIEEAHEILESTDLINKLMIGANSDDTFLISKNNATNYQHLQAVFQKHECMIQPFMKNITLEGEFSLMYFNGKLSHAILKTAATGDYRVQEEHGGGVIPINEPE